MNGLARAASAGVPLILCCFLLGPGCGGGSTVQPPGGDADLASAHIGPEGGDLVVEDASSPLAGMVLTVPPEALTEVTRITANDVSVAGHSHPIVRLGPPNLEFERDVSLKMPVPRDDFDAGLGQRSLSVFSLSEGDGRWHVLPTTALDPGTQTVAATLRHFSSFTVSRGEVTHETPGHAASGHAVILLHGVQPAFSVGVSVTDCSSVELWSPRVSCDATFGELKTILAGLGYDVWSFDYNPSDWIEISAGHLGYAVEQILEQKFASGYDTDRGVSFVAHSMGGLVARTYVQSRGLNWVRFFPWPETERVHYRGDVKTLVMLATPNHGSIFGLVNFLGSLGPDCESLLSNLVDGMQMSSVELIPGSSFLDKLNDTALLYPLPKGITYVNLHGYRFPLLTGDEGTDGVVDEGSARLDEWSALPGYDITERSVDCTHVDLPFLQLPNWDQPFSPGIADIPDESHPSWPHVRDALPPAEEAPPADYDFDFNGDGTVDLDDYEILMTGFALGWNPADTVYTRPISALRRRFGVSSDSTVRGWLIAADVNGDSALDDTDRRLMESEAGPGFAVRTRDRDAPIWESTPTTSRPDYSIGMGPEIGEEWRSYTHFKDVTTTSLGVSSATQVDDARLMFRWLGCKSEMDETIGVYPVTQSWNENITWGTNGNPVTTGTKVFSLRFQNASGLLGGVTTITHHGSGLLGTVEGWLAGTNNGLHLRMESPSTTNVVLWLPDRKDTLWARDLQTAGGQTVTENLGLCLLIEFTRDD